MVERIEKKRKVVKLKDGNFRFELEEEQLYDLEAVTAMIKSWNEQKGQYEAFLKNFDKTIEEGIKALKEKLDQQKLKVKKELEFIEEGLKLWQNPEEEL